MKYYLIGKNIETSLSPNIHNFLFKLKGRKPTYQQPKSSKTFTLRQMQDDSFGGMSITIPYKTLFKNQPFIEKKGDFCTKHGIINTIYKDRQRKLIGVNTDIFGIQKCYSNKVNVEHKNGLILGAGATAQSFCGFFQKHNFKVSFINRSQRKQQLKQKFNNVVDFLPIRPQSVDIKIAHPYSTVVNTLPSQVVYQNWEQIEVNLRNLLKIYSRQTKTKILYMNVNYRIKLDPIQQFLKSQLNLYIETLKGIDMLLWQAIEQNRYFCQQGQTHEEESKWQYQKLKKQLNLL